MKTRIIFFFILSFLYLKIFSQHKLIEKGIASYYHDYLSNNTTANGEVYKPEELTAAHLSLPFNSIVSVTNLNNNKTISVRINDRGPFIDKRIIDLSRAAADSLDFIYQGLTNVVVKVIHFGKTDKLSTKLVNVSNNKPEEFEKFKSITVNKSNKTKPNPSIIKKNIEFNSVEADKYDINSENKISYYGVQVSSFRNRDNMIKFAEKLKREFTESINIQKIELNNLIFYRVIIGDFKTEQDAKLFNKKIDGKFKGSFTIKY